MSYPINPNIPDATHDPADDQGPMQNNFSNINSYLQVDHTDPAATNAGQHKQVTFATNNVPSLPTPTFGGNNIGVLFTNTVAGGTVDQLFYYAGSSGQSSSQYTAGIQWQYIFIRGHDLKMGKIRGHQCFSKIFRSWYHPISQRSLCHGGYISRCCIKFAFESHRS